MSQDMGTHEVLGFPWLPVNPVDICGSDCNSLKALHHPAMWGSSRHEPYWSYGNAWDREKWKGRNPRGSLEQL